ncbi:MAG: hypothetical protein H7837_13950 [Magnetococcus sp. MYC-9]
MRNWMVVLAVASFLAAPTLARAEGGIGMRVLGGTPSITIATWHEPGYLHPASRHIVVEPVHDRGERRWDRHRHRHRHHCRDCHKRRHNHRHHWH